MTVEQELNHLTPPDDVTIAYALADAGEPLVLIPGWTTHLGYFFPDPSSSAAPGQTVVSSLVPEVVAGIEFEFVDRGMHELEGVAEPLRLHRLVWRETGV